MKNFYGQVDVNTEKHCIGRAHEVTKCLMHLEDRTFKEVLCYIWIKIDKVRREINLIIRVGDVQDSSFNIRTEN